MNTRVEIGKRIKKLRQENNLSQTNVAEILFITQAAYSLIENSQNGIVAEHLVKLSKLYDVSADYILTGEDNYIKIGRESGFIPLLRTHAHAGFIKAMTKDSFYDIKDWFRIPGFNPSEEQLLFEVEGNSMAPTLFAGDVLVCQLQHNTDKILDGSAVVLITVEGIMVKRLRRDKDSEYWMVENDNEAHGEIDRLNKDDVKKIMMISGKISSVLVPHSVTDGKARMQNLEDSVETLRKELLDMNKKLNSVTNNK
ncbi:S24 family peptidase [Gramella sp. KN1008]|uniref:XRE family transcriptional regulator n=1 Tax=Gramella sp. KN1008 TaxID=2529298 RepID=UPI00103BE682|nr:S24 family peptidase [Gramella sp. KN1008]TBW28336.1 LexA family transcriptional regulator [Gramella sp. KN1008]